VFPYEYNKKMLDRDSYIGSRAHPLDSVSRDCMAQRITAQVEGVVLRVKLEWATRRTHHKVRGPHHDG
jgi:hypothetical protein